MKNRFEKEADRLLLLLVAGAIAIFFLLYFSTRIPIESAEKQGSSTLSTFEEEKAILNGQPFEENKDLYDCDPSLYDVYISVFPTPNENGEMLDYSAFSKHKALDHSYNPLLNCNIQILEEDQQPDPLTSLDSKNATIRVRGNSSRGAAIKNYKIKLDEEAGSFKGQTTLNINKHIRDQMKLTTKFQTDLLSKVMGLGSYQTYFMRVWLRDASKPADEQKFEYQGLFTEIEQPNKAYLEKRGLSTRGSLYKAEDFAFLQYDEIKNTDDPAYDQEAFESRLSICEGGEDHSAIIAAVNAVNDRSTPFDEVLDTYFSEDNLLTWIAFSLLVKNEDILNHNFLLYNNGYSDTIYFIPWDMDAALRFDDHHDTKDGRRTQRSIQKLNQSVLIRRFLRMDGTVEKIKQKMEELLDGPLSEKNIDELLDSYRPVLEKTLGKEPGQGFMYFEPEEYWEEVDKLAANIRNQKSILEEVILYPVPNFVSFPTLNEDYYLELAWEPSYSYQQLPIHYNVEIYSDYECKDLLYKKTDITDTYHVTEKTFDPGTYFLLVKSIDSEGHEQISMEHYEFRSTSGSTIYRPGLLQFTVSEPGEEASS